MAHRCLFGSTLAVTVAALVLSSCAGNSAAPVPGTSSQNLPPAGDPSGAAPSGAAPSSAAPSSAAPSGGGGVQPGFAQPLRSAQPRGAAGNPEVAGAALDSLGSVLLGRLPAGDNAVLSPYSVYAVLAMAATGAKGATAAQLDALLGGDEAVQAGNVTAVDEAVAAALAAGRPVVQSDPRLSDSRPERVDVANSIWLSPTLPVRSTYLDALATGFGVGTYEVDYRGDPEAVRRAINSWVDQHTGKLIPELLGKGLITEDSVITLVNALRLSAPWAKAFDTQVAPITFITSAGTKAAAPGMSVTGQFISSSGRGWTSVTIPYRGGGLAMTVVLPDPGAFGAVRAELPTVLRTATASRAALPVRLTVPTFGSQTHLSLTAALKSLGVTDIFDVRAADLSGIAGDPGNLFATDLVHQSVITVDERGTEAAAATALTIEAAAGHGGEIKTVTVDRPFFYSVHDTTTGAPLFLGQITDPSA